MNTYRKVLVHTQLTRCDEKIGIFHFVFSMRHRHSIFHHKNNFGSGFRYKDQNLDFLLAITEP